MGEEKRNVRSDDKCGTGTVTSQEEFRAKAGGRIPRLDRGGGERGGGKRETETERQKESQTDRQTER